MKIGVTRHGSVYRLVKSRCSFIHFNSVSDVVTMGCETLKSDQKKPLSNHETSKSSRFLS